MNKLRVYKIIQYALLAAGREDDFFSKDLGPIHFIKYVYLADLNYAKHNNGKTFTEAQWRFYKFGPWSIDINDCIEPALDEIGAHCKTLPSQYDGCDDYKRWSLSDERLFEKLEMDLPVAVSGIVASMVHRFTKDTPSLLEHVYRTDPLLNAAPGEFLDFSSAVMPKEENSGNETKWTGLSVKKKKGFQKAMQSIRAESRTRKHSKEKNFVPSPLPYIQDDIYYKGLDWIDSLAGEAIVPGVYEASFSGDVWHSKTRKGDFSE